MSTENVDVPTGQVADDSYVSRSGHKNEPLPVQSDNAKVEDPIDGTVADSDAQLERDEKDAIDTSNIIDERTRGSQPATSYREPGDEEGLPSDTGRSSTR
ncbi:hypothetical protein S40285_08144 [Stachybotrys chlorohalonatus IBT 40285]|uniref:Histone chaperone domain-containing protein n=1 Tax=Stachybotrys chlorohalonatus (strain IBT 40285) TaxID=1283841 RepID=A0A084QQ45_STAC4|nr:hypothetical protein S40285_08144 [Stachybotrys chlorohalonata IBT 40285]